ncbi:hypothetical protein DFP72DRAFT_896290 [Ephemerocybe angulata]|uniref:Uncharacterized protein n=1 Tax=Ephemerocybe angulata TaxID=980116 RepID=A0A8H6I0I0_9AGAR|nr:hypothetical protein DFP72DRAFT_896290 [Tulosesus angulatus]
MSWAVQFPGVILRCTGVASLWAIERDGPLLRRVRVVVVVELRGDPVPELYLGEGDRAPYPADSGQRHWLGGT